MIKPDCGSCRFSEVVDEKNVVCRLNPPTPYPIPVQSSRLVGGGAPSMGQMSLFPVVGKDNWCGQYEEYPFSKDKE